MKRYNIPNEKKSKYIQCSQFSITLIAQSHTFGSKNTTGSLLLIELNSRPFAHLGPRGMTTTNPGVCAR